MGDEVCARLERVERLLEQLLAGQAPPARSGWLSLKEAAVEVGVSVKHLRREVLAGMLAAANLGTPDRPLYRIAVGDLAAYLERRKAGPVVPPGGRRKKRGGPTESAFFGPQRG
jgi:hypothetical protein